MFHYCPKRYENLFYLETPFPNAVRKDVNLRRFKWFVLSLVIIFSAVAFVPVISFPWNEKINWQIFANAYGTDLRIYLPVILR